MLNKKILLLIFIAFLTVLEAHKIPGIALELEKLENDKIHINAFFKRSKRPLVGNEVRLISMFDNRVLNIGKTTKKGLILNIPNESYWVYLLVRDNDIVVDGIAPKNGFIKTVKKDKIAFIYSFIIIIIFLLLSLIIAYKKSINFKKSL